MNVVEYRRENENKTQWFTIGAMIVYHILAVAALFTFSWQNFAVAALLWWLTGSLGIGLGFHRLLTHKGFKVPKWLEYTLTLLGMLSLQSGAIAWVTSHRMHHLFTDADGDPHSPREKGFLWSHIVWLFKGSAQENDEATCRKYAPDLMKDKVHVFLNKYFMVPTAILGLILLAVGGFSMVFWGIFLRTVWGWHCTFLVNSATHLWGTRRFETGEDSRNNGLVALLTFGEGWHNNHHANPVSARHGLTWYEIDINWITLKLLEAMGLVTQMKEHNIEKTRVKTLRKTAEAK
jgi:sn-1 stearoyl-lipid 9-desaturase